ncbi:MAG: hypothetical protein WBL53_24660, partial [Pseudonocardiaceae bacterium]
GRATTPSPMITDRVTDPSQDHGATPGPAENKQGKPMIKLDCAALPLADSTAGSRKSISKKPTPAISTGPIVVSHSQYGRAAVGSGH